MSAKSCGVTIVSIGIKMTRIVTCFQTSADTGIAMTFALMQKGNIMKSTHNILVEDIEQMDAALDRLSDRRDIWQNDLIWWLCKSVRDILLVVIKKIR